MKLFLSLLLAFLPATVLVSGATTSASGLRKTSEVAESACNSAKTEEACFATRDGEDDASLNCVWCECQAIPSECLSPSQAQQVPSGVFDCKTPADATNAKKKTTSSSSNWYDRVELIAHDVADDAFCDAKSKSGYFSVKGSQYDEDGEDKNLFYWMFEKRTVQEGEIVPFVVWLTGGPGCSSTLALLTENGPCSVDAHGESTETNPYSWTESAHVLWLDQPAGVGFSYGTASDTNEDMISEDAYYFLQAFFQNYPDYQSSPLFIVGESYGGHYTPALAHRIWKGNQAKLEKTIPLNLAGIAVGNGLTNPEEQYKWYAEMAYKNSHHIQTVTEQTYETMTAVVPKCVELIHECNAGDSILNTFACQTAFVVCNMGLTSPYQMTGLNPYDIRKECGSHPLCYDFSHITKFMDKPTTRKALHLTDESPSWQVCNMGINLRFHTDWMKDFSPYVADLLNAGIPALIYAGDVDFICNYMGNQAWTYGLEWDHQKEFQQGDPHDWKGHGLARSANGLTFLQVYDAGHMVPTDQPVVALDMITTFLNGGEF